MEQEQGRAIQVNSTAMLLRWLIAFCAHPHASSSTHIYNIYIRLCLYLQFHFIELRKYKDMIKITFPDGSVREYESGVTGLQIAESISSRLAQDVLACGVNGET